MKIDHGMHIGLHLVFFGKTGVTAQYHNEVQEMQAKSDDLIRKNKSLRQKNKGMSRLAC
jgi:hypothetical protein